MGNVSGAILNNYAFDGLLDINNLTTSWTDKGKNTLNGEDVTKTQSQAATFWITDGNWNTSGWDITVWNIKDGKLPILKNVSGLQTTGIISVKPDSENNKVTVNLISPWSGGVLIVAVYKNRKLLDLVQKTITQSGESNVSIYIPDTDEIKAMMWDRLNTMQPLSEAKTIEKDDNGDWITVN